MKDNYLTPEYVRERLKLKRDAIKAIGGEEYARLLEKERADRAAYRKRHPNSIRQDRRKREKTSPTYFKSRLLIMARRRGRKAGLESTVRSADIHWPTHCPILGIELDYKTLRGKRRAHNPSNPSLDRWDNTRGYVPGNVFVISYRANALKGNATWQELEALARYARYGLVR